MDNNINFNHPIWKTVIDFLQLETAPSLLEPIIAENDQLSLARDKMFAITHVISSLIESTPATLVSLHALNQLNKHIRTAYNELKTYASNKNVTHINNAATQFEQHVLPLLWGFTPIIRTIEHDVLPEIFEGLRRSASETIKQLMQERDNFASHIQALEAVATELESRLNTMTDSAARERAEASAAIAKLEQAFAAKETERAAKFEAIINNIKTDYSTLEQTTKNESALLISGLEEQKNNAAKIVQVVGNIGVTGNYQRIANTEAKQANFWRWTTVLFFTGGVTLAIATFYKFWGEPITSESIWAVAVRLLYAIAITAPAWYMARESARHRTNSDRARQTELELASLGPFIEFFPDEKKVTIREEMTKHYFGREIDPHTTKAPLDAETLKDLVIEVCKALKK